MDELIGRIVTSVGIERPVAERAVGIIFDFIATEGPADKVPRQAAAFSAAWAVSWASAAG